MVSVNFPIYLDPRSSLSEKNSKKFNVYYTRKQDLVLYYELLLVLNYVIFHFVLVSQECNQGIGDCINYSSDFITAP